MVAGIGRAEGDLGQLAKMAHRPDAAQRWSRAKVLVIDEVRDFCSLPSPITPFCSPPAKPPPHTQRKHDHHKSCHLRVL